MRYRIPGASHDEREPRYAQCHDQQPKPQLLRDVRDRLDAPCLQRHCGDGAVIRCLGDDRARCDTQGSKWNEPLLVGTAHGIEDSVPHGSQRDVAIPSRREQEAERLAAAHQQVAGVHADGLARRTDRDVGNADHRWRKHLHVARTYDIDRQLHGIADPTRAALDAGAHIIHADGAAERRRPSLARQLAHNHRSHGCVCRLSFLPAEHRACGAQRVGEPRLRNDECARTQRKQRPCEDEWPVRRAAHFAARQRIVHDRQVVRDGAVHGWCDVLGIALQPLAKVIIDEDADLQRDLLAGPHRFRRDERVKIDGNAARQRCAHDERRHRVRRRRSHHDSPRRADGLRRSERRHDW